MNRLTDQKLREKIERNLKSHLEANRVKDRLSKLGYYYTISLYGVISNPETQHPEYRRIEVFLNGLPTQANVQEIKQFFCEIKPYHYYSIWAYNCETHQIIMVEDWE